MIPSESNYYVKNYINWYETQIFQSMQSKDDMAVSLMSMTPEAEELLLDRIEAEVQREQAARDQLNVKRDQRTRQRQDIQNERAKV